MAGRLGYHVVSQFHLVGPKGGWEGDVQGVCLHPSSSSVK